MSSSSESVSDVQIPVRAFTCLADSSSSSLPASSAQEITRLFCLLLN
ncbi:hypothetical protein A2U01_0087403, partial [Trifolium medium]|nr:hypothetical protein [Trifolium medium]